MNKYDNDDYKFGFMHYVRLFLINYKISFKSILEYKANFYSSLITVFFWDLSFIIMGLILKDNFLPIIEWSFVDYCIFLLFMYLCYNFSAIFIANKFLGYIIPKGNLNQYFYRPGNKFLNYFLSINFNTIIVSLGNLIIFVPIILLYGNITLKYLHLIFLIFFLSLIFIICIWHFINSLSFYFLKISNVCFKIYDEISYSLQGYTPMFFEKNSFKAVLFLFHIYYIAKLIIPLFHGIIIDGFWNYILILVSLIIIFSIGITINWKYGLKRYEAFG